MGMKTFFTSFNTWYGYKGTMVGHNFEDNINPLNVLFKLDKYNWSQNGSILNKELIQNPLSIHYNFIKESQEGYFKLSSLMDKCKVLTEKLPAWEINNPEMNTGCFGPAIAENRIVGKVINLGEGPFSWDGLLNHPFYNDNLYGFLNSTQPLIGDHLAHCQNMANWWTTANDFYIRHNLILDYATPKLQNIQGYMSKYYTPITSEIVNDPMATPMKGLETFFGHPVDMYQFINYFIEINNQAAFNQTMVTIISLGSFIIYLGYMKS